TGDSRNVHQPGTNRIYDEFRGLVDAQSVHDVGTVNGDRVGAEIEHGGNVFVRFSVNDHLQDFYFAGSQSAPFTFERGLLLNLRIEDRFSRSYLAHGGSEFKLESILENVSSRTGLYRLSHPGVLGVHAEHQDGGVRQGLDNFSRGLKAVGAGERAIHHHDLRAQLLREPDGFLSVSGLADDPHIGFIFQHAPKAAPDEAVVIDQQDCDLLFHKTRLSRAESPDAPEFRLRAGATGESRRPSIRNARALLRARCRAGSDVP